jgi:hypothetical protein
MIEMRTLGIDLEPTYENFYATCPYCRDRNIFNRVSDLKTEGLISGKPVQCLKCDNEFWINGDIINPPFEYFLWDAENFKRDKRYMYCILNIAQAYEIFFSLYLLIEVVNEPYYNARIIAEEPADRRMDLGIQVNELLDLFYTKIHDYTFGSLRNLFIWRIIESENTPLKSLDESKQAVEIFFENFRKKEPSNEKIQGIQNAKLSKILQQLKDSKINVIRNQVVHKHAYRPSLSEIEKYLDEAKEILYPLRTILDFEQKYHHIPPKI